MFLDVQGRKRGELSLALGEATNNVAESCALIVALQEALRRGTRRVTVETDSQLLARQVTGAYRVKDRQLRWLHVLIQHLLPSFSRFEIRHIPREENRQADRLASRAVSQSLKQAVAPTHRPKHISKSDPTQLTLF